MRTDPIMKCALWVRDVLETWIENRTWSYQECESCQARTPLPLHTKAFAPLKANGWSVSVRMFCPICATDPERNNDPAVAKS